MSLGLWNLQWLNHNSQRSYPIADWASKCCDVSDDIKLPDDFILAVNFAVSAANNVSVDLFYIKSVSVSNNGISICIGYKDYGNAVAVSHLVNDGNNEIITAALTGLNDFDDTVGYIAINAKSSVFSLSPGYYTFEYEATALEPDCIRPMLRSITSLRIQNSGGYSERLYGDIVLVAGNNIAIDILSSTPKKSVVRISAVSDDYTDTCADTDNSKLVPIKTINGVSPNAAGNITINGEKCLEISSGSSCIILADSCAEPCCGCPELNSLEAQINRLSDGKVTLEGFAQRLIAGIESLEIAYLGSK